VVSDILPEKPLPKMPLPSSPTKASHLRFGPILLKKRYAKLTEKGHSIQTRQIWRAMSRAPS
jgi:hypothetical protein